MKATNYGKLSQIDNCYLKFPNDTFGRPRTIVMNNLPDISDTKNAVYNEEAIMGRSVPLYTYSHSGSRVITLGLHFFVVEQQDVDRNLKYLSWIQSATYPDISTTAPYSPPGICKIKCGQLLGNNELCIILQSYSVKFPTEVAWDEKSFCPFKFDVDTTWWTVYSSSQLPNSSDIVSSRIITI